MEIKTIANNTLILASPKVLKFIVGLVKSKFIAIFLGVTGFGLIDQLSHTINQIRNLSLSFLPHGMVKLIAEQNAKGENLKNITDIIKTYFVMVLPLAVVITILGYVFADEITVFIFGDIKYKLYFLIGFTALPITICSTSLHGLFRAFKEIKSIAFSEFLIIIFNLILFLPLVYYYKVIGGIIYITSSFFVSFGVIFFVVRKNVFKKYNITFANIKNAVFNHVYFKELLAFISIGILVGVFRVFENVTIRSIVVNELGIDKLGVYSPITKWSSLFIGFILPSAFTYLYPRISEAKDDKDISDVINDTIRLLTFVILPFVICGIATRQWIIPLFFSNDFIEATLYLPFHFSALIIVVWSTILEQIFAPTGRLKMFLAFVIVLNLISLSLVYYLVPVIGLYGYLARFTIIPIITIIVYYIYWRHEIKFKIKKENIYIMLYSLLCCAILILMRNVGIYFQLLSLLLVIPMIFLLKPKERDFLLKKIKLKK